MNQSELDATMRASVAMVTQGLTDDELAALSLCAQLDSDPRGRLFTYEDVRPLFDQDNGLKMHSETKKALLAVTRARFGRA
jgi:hypothetical protein